MEEANTEGALLLVVPIADTSLDFSEVVQIIGSGSGPTTRAGGVRQGYFFGMTGMEGQALLRAAGLKTISVSQKSFPDNLGVPEDYKTFFATVTDRYSVIAVRAEQAFLRREQLHIRGNVCSLCGRKLPPELLAAAQIKPRWACSELERMDTSHVAMLACLLGCDALYELGIVVVDRYVRI